jgi:hypothetical protein
MTTVPEEGTLVMNVLETIGLAKEKEFVNVENWLLELITIQRSSNMLIDRVHTVDESDTHSEPSQRTVPILTRGVVSLVPNLLPKTVITDAATTG